MTLLDVRATVAVGDPVLWVNDENESAETPTRPAGRLVEIRQAHTGRVGIVRAHSEDAVPRMWCDDLSRLTVDTWRGEMAGMIRDCQARPLSVVPDVARSGATGVRTGSSHREALAAVAPEYQEGAGWRPFVPGRDRGL